MDGLWYTMWKMGIKGKMWRVVRSLYVNDRSCIFLEDDSSELFPSKQGVAQGCTLSWTLFSVNINDLLCEIEKCTKLGDKLSEKTLSGFLFADDLFEVAETGLALKNWFDIALNYSKRWCFEAKVKSVLL